MRTDEANHILGLRVNVWTSIVVFLGGVVLFRWTGRRRLRAGPAGVPQAPTTSQDVK
jgi:hypothetical protein